MGPGSVILDVLSAEQAYKQEIAHQLCSRVSVLLCSRPLRELGVTKGELGVTKGQGLRRLILKATPVLKATPLEERAFP